jgi:hypothetical protein
MSTAAFAPSQQWSPSARGRTAPPTVAQGATVIGIKPPQPFSWLDRVVARINVLAALEPGWDGDSALPPTRQAALAALNGLFEVMWPDSPAPSVVPMYDGGVQLEWHGPGLDIELTAAPDGSRQVWIGAASGLEIEDDFRLVVEDLRKHVGTLTRG